MALKLKGRALHFVFKIGNRKEEINFYKDILGMIVLRHEEFAEGCEASCNGLYNDRWSKTMVGYGPEDNNFVVELTYNYGIKTYEMGNDFIGITIKSSEVLARARDHNYPLQTAQGNFFLESPGGYKFYVINEPQPKNREPIEKVTLACSNMLKTTRYWNTILGLKIMNQTDQSVAFAFDEKQCWLEFREIKTTIEHMAAYGRIAFSVPKESLPGIQTKMETANQKILTPIISLNTPDKATVTVIVLADPDGHEICFVDDENFRLLSAFDPKADDELKKYIKYDKTQL